MWITPQCQHRIASRVFVGVAKRASELGHLCADLMGLITSHRHVPPTAHLHTYFVWLHRSPQILHPFVSLGWWTAGKTFASRGGSDLPRRQRGRRKTDDQTSWITMTGNKWIRKTKLSSRVALCGGKKKRRVHNGGYEETGDDLAVLRDDWVAVQKSNWSLDEFEMGTKRASRILHNNKNGVMSGIIKISRDLWSLYRRYGY